MTTASMASLARANVVRIEGARWRREVRALPRADARLELARMLERRQLPPEIGALRLGHFLRAARNVYIRVTLGVAKVRRDPTTTRIRDLTVDERRRLAAALRGMGA